MDEHLDGREWFVGDAMSLADICLFAYTHVADDAEFDLELYPNDCRVAGADESPAAVHVPMDA